MKPGLVVYALLLSVTIVLAGSCSSVSTSDTPTVVKLDVTMGWSASSCLQVLDEEDISIYPNLTVDPEAISPVAVDLEVVADGVFNFTC